MKAIIRSGIADEHGLVLGHYDKSGNLLRYGKPMPPESFHREPRIGDYYAECCLLDLYKIETEDDLAAVNERLAGSEDCGPLMLFPSLAEAVEALQGELDAEAERREFERLGWA